MTPSVTFVLCIESNAIRGQALLLCESIRRWCGPHADAPIVAVSPRPGLGVDHETQRQLASMAVEYIEAPLNIACPLYGSANRVFAAAWVEPRAASEWIVVLDSDTIFLDGLEIPIDADAAVRPVDVKGTATEGPGDRFEDYWSALATLQGVELDRLPFVRTTVGGHLIRASYNGGLVIVRRDRGLLTAWADLFARSVAAGLKPLRGIQAEIQASTGRVRREALDYWGSNQAALAVTLWSREIRVAELSPRYNVPLTYFDDAVHRVPEASPPAHVHYHWCFTTPHHRRAMTALTELGVDEERLSWLDARLPLS